MKDGALSGSNRFSPFNSDKLSEKNKPFFVSHRRFSERKNLGCDGYMNPVLEVNYIGPNLNDCKVQFVYLVRPGLADHIGPATGCYRPVARNAQKKRSQL